MSLQGDSPRTFLPKISYLPNITRWTENAGFRVVGKVLVHSLGQQMSHCAPSTGLHGAQLFILYTSFFFFQNAHQTHAICSAKTWTHSATELLYTDRGMLHILTHMYLSNWQSPDEVFKHSYAREFGKMGVRSSLQKAVYQQASPKLVWQNFTS